MIKNIIFDWSGVINDNASNVCETANDMFEQLGGKRISLEEFRKEYQAPYMEFYNKYFPNLSMEEEQKLFSKYIVNHSDHKLYPGMRSVLESLKSEGLNMIIFSADPKSMFLSAIDQFGLDGMFDEFYCDVHDKTEEIEKILATHNYKGEETVFIGDTPNDSDAGKKGNTKTILVSWGFCDMSRLKSANPDYIVQTPEEIREIILKN